MMSESAHVRHDQGTLSRRPLRRPSENEKR